jgi:hypothetical protein
VYHYETVVSTIVDTKKTKIKEEHPMNEIFLTVGDAARILGKSPECIRGYERSGKLAAIKTQSGVRLFRRKDVERLAQQQTTERSAQGARAAV